MALRVATYADEKALVDGLRRREDAAFIEAADRFGPRLHKVAMRILHDEQRAEDAVQEGWTQLLKHAKDFRGDSLLSTWLHRVVVNQALMLKRADKRRPAVSLGETGDDQPDGHSDAEVEFVEPEPVQTEITARVEEVTPEAALSMLTTLEEGGNRCAMPKHVEFIAEQIAAGRWTLNGQSIVLAATGKVLDGQHRLRACVRAGKSIRAVVVRGVDPVAFATIDTGVKRTATHVLQIRGRTDCNNLAAALRLIANYRERAFGGTRGRVTNQRILDLDESNPDMQGAVRWAHGAYPKMREKHVWTTPAAAFFRYYASALDEKAAARFCDVLVDVDGKRTGAYAWPASSALALRERLYRGWRRHERLVVHEVLASFILAWNSRKAPTWESLVWIRGAVGARDATPFPQFAKDGAS